VTVFLNRATLCVSAAIAVVAWLSVTRRDAGIVCEWIKILSNFFLDLVAPPLWFSNTTYGYELLAGRGACHLDFFQSETLNNGSAGE